MSSAFVFRLPVFLEVSLREILLAHCARHDSCSHITGVVNRRIAETPKQSDTRGGVARYRTLQERSGKEGGSRLNLMCSHSILLRLLTSVRVVVDDVSWWWWCDSVLSLLMIPPHWGESSASTSIRVCAHTTSETARASSSAKDRKRGTKIASTRHRETTWLPSMSTSKRCGFLYAS